MNVSQSISALTAALVHPSAMGSRWERTRHQTFILRMLGVAFAVLAVAPFFLAFHGAPTAAQAILFGLCLTPLGAVMLVLKTGRLAAGHAVGVCTLSVLGIVAAVGAGAGLGGAAAWLIAAQVEGLLSGHRRLALAALAMSGLTFAALVALTLLGRLPAPAATPEAAVVIGLAIACATFDILCLIAPDRNTIEGEDAATERSKAIAHTMGDLVVTYDAQGTVDFVGSDAEKIFNVATRDLLGRGLFERVHVADRPAFLNGVADAAHGVDPVTVTFRLRTPGPQARRDGGRDAAFVWVEMRARRMPGANPGVLALLRDIAANKRNETDLESARRGVEIASRSKEHFLANMSHELRTPLNAIIGFSEILGSAGLRPTDAAKQTEYARIIHQSGQHLLAVVNSILDMAKIQSGTFAIDPAPFRIAPLIDSCCEIVTLNAQERGVELVRADTSAIDSMVGDRRACKQILINLLSNAVKFTPRNGRVTIAAQPEGTSLSISVTDTGIGIDAEDLVRLGDPFFQVKSALDRPYEGTGLGLSVVRGLVGLHGGTISIESELGYGTSVTVRLPLDCRVTGPHGGSATIETMTRRRALNRFAAPPHATRVKKIA